MIKFILIRLDRYIGKKYTNAFLDYVITNPESEDYPLMSIRRDVWRGLRAVTGDMLRWIELKSKSNFKN